MHVETPPPGGGISKRLTPPQVAHLYGVKPHTVLLWIRSGELRAFDVSRRQGGRPRFLIAAEELEAFERRRAAVPVQRAPRQQRLKQPGIIEYYK